MRNMRREFWAGKRVFITGHTGFKGSWLAMWLHELGAEVSGYALEPPTVPNMFGALGIGRRVSSIHGDVRDLEPLKSALDLFRPQIVLHLAAQSSVPRSYVSPVETYATNIMGTVNVLEAVRQVSGVRALVCVSSDKCYENKEWVWGYREVDSLGGHDPYSSSKGCCELVVAGYRRSFFESPGAASSRTGVATARAGNVIGGGDWSSGRLVPDLVRAVTGGSTILLRHPEATRPWQHVLDALDGYLMLAEGLWGSTPDLAEGWNFGPPADVGTKVCDLVELFLQTWGSHTGWKRAPGRTPHEARSLTLLSSKARERLKWWPKLDLEATVEWTVEWHKAFNEGRDMAVLTREQIDRYESIVR